MRTNTSTNVLIVTTILLLTVPGQSVAQRTDATFAGVVQDPTGAVLPGVEVQMINEGTAASTQQVTNETGEFRFDFVPVGTYTLKIALPGFKSYESRGIPLGAAQNVRRTYTLEVGSVTDSVTVTGEAAMVNTLSPEQRFALETREVTSLPMINRNITSILEVGAGLTKGESDGRQSGVRFRLNGLGGSAMSVTANGTDANGNAGSPTISLYGGANKIDVMSSEAVAEVQVVKGVIPAEYGWAMGGNMSLITKSGTNAWHGSLFHRYEGSVLSARQPFLAREPNSVWNQFGGSLGGPIKRDKAFFFFAYEGYRQRSAVAISPTVPTPRFRDILLSSLPFPETRIVLDHYPLPNQPYAEDALLALWVGAGDKQNDDDHFDWKFDYMVGGGNFSLSFAGGHPYQSQALSQPLVPQLTFAEQNRASANYVIGRGRWTSSTRGGYNRNKVDRVEKLWFIQDPNKAETIPGWRRLSRFTFPGLTGLGSEQRMVGVKPSFSFEQQVAFSRGTHSWKFGGILNMPGGGQVGTSGASVSFQTLQDVLLNQPATTAFSSGKPPNKWRMYNFGFFTQDDWRIHRKLVLNLGLRYDRSDNFAVKPWHENIPACTCNLDGLIDPVNFIFGPLRPLDSPINSDPLSLSPRFGFAYTADNAGNLVLRGGFGVNFQGLDPSSYEEQTSRKPTLPSSRSFTRAESIARGLKYPIYNEDTVKIVEAEGGGKPQIGGRWNPNMNPPYAYNYTLGIQHALNPTLMIETAYVGTRGIKFNMRRPYNPPDRITGLRPNPNDISGDYNDTSQQTSYNSWQTSLRQRMTKGLLFNIHYTWGKGMSITGGDTAIQSIGDTRYTIEDFDLWKLDRSPSSGDVTHNLVLDWVYDVPTPFADSVVARHVFGGWQISGIWKGMTGIPIRLTQTGGRPDILDIKRAVNTECCSYGDLQYLNPAAFQMVPISVASNRTIRRGHASGAPLRGPGITNLNLSMGKTFSLVEAKTLEVRADVLNAFNQTQYKDISTNMNAIDFGKATGTASARVIQLQLRFAF